MSGDTRVAAYLSPALYYRQGWDWKDFATPVAAALRTAGRESEADAAALAIRAAPDGPATRAAILAVARPYVGFGAADARALVRPQDGG